MRRLLTIAALSMAALSCDSVEKPQVETATSWRQIQMNGFSFYAPPALTRDHSVQPIDSYAGTFRMTGIEIGFDYGMHSKWYEGESLNLNGAFAATLLVTNNPYPESLPYLAILSARPQSADTPSLTMSAGCASEADLETALQILRSVTFD